jgi:hypothetical protein
MSIYLLDKTLQVDITYACEDLELEDNICVSVIERCPPAEKVLCAGQTHLFLTPTEARILGEALLEAADLSDSGRHK